MFPKETFRKRHQQRGTCLKKNTQSPEEREAQKLKERTCSVCNRVFYSKYEVKLHMKMHTHPKEFGKKPTVWGKSAKLFLEV